MEFSTVNQLLLADADQIVDDDDILRLAYGIENFEFSPYNKPPFDNPTPEMRARLKALRARLAVLRDRDNAAVAPPSKGVTVLCDCGHRVPAIRVMSTSGGTSCPACYDRMSQ